MVSGTGPYRGMNGLKRGVATEEQGPHRGMNGLRNGVLLSILTQACFNMEQGLALLAFIAFA